MWKFILAWFPMIFIAIINGLFREKFLTNHLNQLQAHQVSTFIVIVLLSIYVWILFKIWSPQSVNQSIYIGLTWLLLTVIFEFLFGHYVIGHSWDKLLHNYNLLQGRIWVLVLFWITIVPYIFIKYIK